MTDEGPRPLNYAEPHRRRGFEVHWGGWILLALVAAWGVVMAIEWLRYGW